MSSFICKILVAKGGKKVDRSTCIDSLGKLKTALNAQSKFNALFTGCCVNTTQNRWKI